MQFGLLGNLEVVVDGAPVDVGGAQPRTVLAMLLVARGRVVPAGTIMDALWGDEPPASAAGTLQSYASRLRRALGGGQRGAGAKILRWEPPGYRLVVEPDAVDAWRFEALADRGRALLDTGDPSGARQALSEAVALWRGAALLEFAHLDFAWGTAARLEEQRLVATEDRIEAELQLGHHVAVVGELGEMVAAHPLREGLRGHLALALYRAGRQAEALRVLDDARRTLRDQLGIDPSPALREMEAAILAHDAGLASGPTAGHEPTSVPAAAPKAPVTEGPEVAAAPAAPAVPGSGALFGRETELARLVAALDEAARATRVVVVEGEPGIGKTRLLEAFTAVAAGRGRLLLCGRSFEAGGAPAFWPWLPALRQLVAHRPDGEVPPDVATLVATHGQGTVPSAPGGAETFRLFEAIAQLITAAAAERPVVVVLDDLQWADPASLELVAFLADRLVDAPVLLVGAVRELALGRSDAVVDTLAALARSAGARRIHLRGLDRPAIDKLVAEATGGEVPPEVAATVAARAEGNPFFAAELARLLADQPGMASARAVPSSVRDVVRRRLGMLPDATHELLSVAAVIGRDLDLELLVAASDQDVDACLDGLDPAVVHRLIAVEPGRTGTFRFAHPLVREVALDEISALRRARLHLRVADALLAQPGSDDDQAEIVAEHLWAAVPVGVGGRAAAALERAAEVAVRRSAFEAAEDLLERAVQLRRAAGADPADTEAELVDCTRLLSIQRSVHGYSSVGGSPHLARAKHIARGRDNVDALVRLLWTEWAAFDASCDLDRADQVAREIRDLAEEDGRPLATVTRLASMGISHWHRGRIGDAVALLDEAVQVSTEVDLHPGRLGLELEVVLLPHPFALYVHDLAGDREVGEIEHAFADIRSLAPDHYAVALVQMLAAAGALSAGDAPRAERAARIGIEADPDHVFSFWTWGSEAYLASALLLQGRLDEGLDLIGRATDAFVAAGGRSGVAVYRSAQAGGLAAAGRLDEAEAALALAHAQIDAGAESFAEPLVREAAALVAHAGGEAAPAVAGMLDGAVALAEAQGARGVARRVARRRDDLAVRAG